MQDYISEDKTIATETTRTRKNCERTRAGQEIARTGAMAYESNEKPEELVYTHQGKCQ